MSTTTSIHPADLRERFTTSAEQPAPRLIDVRTPAEYESGHIPGSVNVPLDVVSASARKLRDRLGDQDVVLVCRSGQRAAQARQHLADAGLASTWVLSGGVAGWDAAGGDLNRGRQVWDLERQVRFAAGSLVLTGVLGSLLAPRLKWLAGFVGGGLMVAGATNTCAMGTAIAKLPWNRPRTAGDPIERVGARG